MSTPENAVVIIDGTAALFRAYFGMRSVTGPDDSEVGALLGMGQWLVRVVDRLRPSHAAVVFDAGARTFRNELYPDYKANRGEPPEDLIPQFDKAQEMTAALGFCIFCEAGYEADDLMATLAKRTRKTKRPTVLVTPDKDVWQLLRDNVHIVEPKHLDGIDAQAVFTKFGVRPDQMCDFQAICGDSTDNIPGVPGIGPKGAAQLLAEFETLSGIYDNLESVPGLGIRGAKSLAKKLEEHRELAELSLKLVTLRDDVPISTPNAKLSDLRYRGAREDADATFDGYGFHGPLRRVRTLFANK